MSLLLSDADIIALLAIDAQTAENVVFFHDVDVDELVSLDFSSIKGVTSSDWDVIGQTSHCKKRQAGRWGERTLLSPPISISDGWDGLPPLGQDFTVKKRRSSPAVPGSPQMISDVSLTLDAADSSTPPLQMGQPVQINGVQSKLSFPKFTAVLSFPIHPVLPRHPSDTQRAVYCLRCIRNNLSPVGITAFQELVAGLCFVQSEGPLTTLQASTSAIASEYKTRPKYVLRKLAFALLPAYMNAAKGNVPRAILPGSPRADYSKIKDWFTRVVLNIATSEIPDVTEHVITVEQSIVLLQRLAEHDSANIRIPDDLRSTVAKGLWREGA